MKMFVANVSFQDHQFEYRVPGLEMKRIGVTIPHGGQSTLPNALMREDIDIIIEQHAQYGMVEASAVDRSIRRVWLLYSIDKPVSIAQIRRAYERNIEVMGEDGMEFRKKAAVVIGDTLQSRDQEAYKHVDIEIREQGDDVPKDEFVANMHVERRREGPGVITPVPGRGKKARRAA